MRLFVPYRQERLEGSLKGLGDLLSPYFLSILFDYRLMKIKSRVCNDFRFF